MFIATRQNLIKLLRGFRGNYLLNRDWQAVSIDQRSNFLWARVFNGTAKLEVILLGSTDVSKICLLHQLCHPNFTDKTVPISGANYFLFKVTIDWTDVNLVIWDTAGQERFRSIEAAVIFYSVMDPPTFDEVDAWKQIIDQCVTGSVPLFLVGNKEDLASDRKVPTAIGQAKAINATFFETSTLTGNNVQDLFTDVGRQILKDHAAKEAVTCVNFETGTQQTYSGFCC
jgi:small GTP-binding protein